MAQFYDFMTLQGRFDYWNNCPILCFLPHAAEYEDRPVIVFLSDRADVTRGELYEFTVKMTRQATYVLDGVTYRVGHAAHIRRLDAEEGTRMDYLLHNSTEGGTVTLGDLIDPEVAKRLQALVS